MVLSLAPSSRRLVNDRASLCAVWPVPFMHRILRTQHLMQVERLRALLASRQPLKLKGKKRKAALVQHVQDGTRLKTAAAETRRKLPLSTA
jgi:hypothetical protein